ncbi:MAG TPA: phage protease [Polyangiaceae bacterium]|nr:phage protease [Polyangiaceae bacterium]
MPQRSAPFALLRALPLTEDGKAPSRILVFRWGMNASEHGEFLFDEKAAASVLAEHERYGNALGFDGEHETFADPKAKRPGVVVSYGWAPRLETDAEGLWAADLDWTDDVVRGDAVVLGGRTLIETRRVKFFSPVFDYEPKTRRILKLKPFALTIYPALHHQRPLAASATEGAPDAPDERPAMEPKPVNAVALLMGLPSSADDGTVCNAVNTMRAGHTALCHALGAADDAGALKRARELADDHRALLSAAGAQTAQEALGAIRAGQVASQRVTALETENGALKKENEDLKRAHLFAEHADRLTPALREEFADKPVSFLSGVLPKLPKAPTSEDEAATPPGAQPPAGQTQTATLSGAGAGQQRPQGGPPPKPVPLTEQQKKIAKQLGLSEQAYAEQLALSKRGRTALELH